MSLSMPHLFHVDAFTRTPFRGNAAGVVLNADRMSAEQMQALARELKHSETAFVLSATESDHDVHIRFFTPTTEVPICGHATIAAHYARAHYLRLSNTVIRQKTGAGIQTIQIHVEQDDYRIEMKQGPIRFEPAFSTAMRAELAQALGLQSSDLEPNLPVQIVSTGHSKVMIPLRPQVQLHDLQPNYQALTSLSAIIKCNGYFPFQIGTPIRDQQPTTEGRMFAPAIGIAEDPVTGNANGPLGAYLVRYQLMKHDGRQLQFNGHQGRALGREGIVSVAVDVANDEAVSISISGEAVILFDALLNL